MATMLITEGLQQIKILTDRIAKARANALKYLTRDSNIVDPMASEGGSPKYVVSQIQAANDLEQQLVDIRLAIAAKNAETVLTIEGVSRTVAEWIVWRREIADKKSAFIASVSNHITAERIKLSTANRNRPMTLNAGASAPADSQLIVALNEKELSEAAEKLAVTLGTLDGKLSVLNATTTIEV